jgi:predicted amidohydrolase
MLSKAEEIKEGTDLLVLPEYANCPGIDSYAEIADYLQKDGGAFLSQICEIARQKKMHIAVNMVRSREHGLYNTTVWIGRSGQIIAEYDKTHLTEAERKLLHMIPGDEVKLLEVEGIRVAFATCFELYFAEFFEKLASLQPDLIVIPTYQRSEISELLAAQARARAIDSGAFLIRCSYSMGEKSTTGGMSMLVHPQGNVICCAGAEQFFR